MGSSAENEHTVFVMQLLNWMQGIIVREAARKLG